jgi:hypothetical protein
MQLGKELATGFVTDDEQVTAGGEASLPAGGADAAAPEASPSPAAPAASAPEPEPAAAG